MTRFTYFVSAAASLLALTALGGCCLGECLGLDERATVYFQFSSDTLAAGAGFRQAEVRSTYVVRYLDAGLMQPRDTLRWLAAPGVGQQLFVTDQRHFQLDFVGDSAVGPVGSYRIAVPAAGRRYDLRNLLVPTTRQRCRNGCDRARGVSFRLDGRPVAFANPQPALADAVVLRR